MGLSSKIRPDSEQSNLDGKLESWKAIAAYLSRDPRTVQLWEKSEGLPIHRLNHRSRATVYAYTSEIDAWVVARSAKAAGVEAPQAAQPAPIVPNRILASRNSRYALGAVACVGILIASIGWLRSHRATHLRGANPTIAVLKFTTEPQSEAPKMDGLSEVITSELGKKGKVPVITRQSVESLSGDGLPLDEVAANLNASLLLRGKVGNSGDEIQVEVELLGEPGNIRQWHSRYTRPKATARQEEIASTIAADLVDNIASSSSDREIER